MNSFYDLTHMTNPQPLPPQPLTDGFIQSMLDASIHGIVLLQPVLEDGRVTDFLVKAANAALKAQLGFALDLTGDQRLTSLFPAYKAYGFFDVYVRALETGQVQRQELYYQDHRLEGWFDLGVAYQEHAVVATFVNVTSYKQAQTQLEESVKELKRSNAYLEDFAYAASHDLQEPLRKIHFFADRLTARYRDQLGEEGAMMLTRMEGATNRMRQLIDDLLTYSRLSSRKNPFEPVLLQDLVKDVRGDLETSIREKQAVLSFSDLPQVTGDKRQLYQLFQNLLSNALKFHKPDEPPRIDIRSRPVLGKDLPQMVPSSDQQRAFHLIEVVDQGQGFEQENAEKIFQMFHRLHGRSEYPGTGVGLAIAHKVVENHKGYIAAESEPDQGAIFRVLLPAQP
ncbi:ATP-binding protein [Paraflavisolibacter sp. H34]|uniref:sensor histidine kinase n=1 Tax=Huijunlia imazamoxiresistens TaxID=3127457 RepID=UPI0030182E7F